MTTTPDITTHTVSIGTVVAWIQLVVAVVLVPATFQLVRRLGDIRDHLGHINGNVKEINQWRSDHDGRLASEERHHEAMHAKCAELHHERLNGVHERISELWERIGDRRSRNKPTD